MQQKYQLAHLRHEQVDLTSSNLFFDIWYYAWACREEVVSPNILKFRYGLSEPPAALRTASPSGVFALIVSIQTVLFLSGFIYASSII